MTWIDFAVRVGIVVAAAGVGWVLGKDAGAFSGGVTAFVAVTILKPMVRARLKRTMPPCKCGQSWVQLQRESHPKWRVALRCRTCRRSYILKINLLGHAEFLALSASGEAEPYLRRRGGAEWIDANNESNGVKRGRLYIAWIAGQIAAIVLWYGTFSVLMDMSFAEPHKSYLAASGKIIDCEALVRPGRHAKFPHCSQFGSVETNPGGYVLAWLAAGSISVFIWLSTRPGRGLRFS
jgi:hypothetical protein